jgi:hypothetical protein
VGHHKAWTRGQMVKCGSVSFRLFPQFQKKSSAINTAD